MADSSKDNHGKKVVAPQSEEAVRAGGRELVPSKRETTRDRGEMEKYLKTIQTGSESATHVGQDLVPTDMLHDGSDLLDALAAEQGMEKAVLKEMEFSPELLAEVPADVARKYGVVPLEATETDLWLAISDPHNVQILDDLTHILNKTIHPRLALEDDIDGVIRRHYAKEDFSEMYDGLAESEETSLLDKKYDELDLGGEEDEINQPPVVKFVDLIFRQAVHDRASDIHVEPNRYGMNIRIRIDGVLQDVPNPPRKWQNAIVSRLKVLAGMDLAEKRVPLDGRIRLTIGERKLDLRVSTLPTIFGESIVMRILDQSQVLMGLADVGFLPRTVETFQKLIVQPNGIILMTGPTGSGKTTTLYAALNALNNVETKLVTLEDPVEYQIPGICQVQINAEIGLNFAAGLRSLLRQSPDVILVGEIRDMETAENAIRAALTGHLVFSTLHTNDAPSSTIRLIDMGVKPYLVASSLQAAIAQRLVRTICSICKEQYTPPDEAILEVGYDPEDYRDVMFFRGKGCDRCVETGYRGRTAIHEIMVMDSDLRRRVIRSEPASRLKKLCASKGMKTLRDDGWEKVTMGVTSIEEVLRITSDN